MIFPNLQLEKFKQVNLDQEAVKWRKKQEKQMAGHWKPLVNPLLDAQICQGMVDEVHRELGVAFSRGGFGEDRRNLWEDSYLSEENKWVHLGEDLNVSAGTLVAAPGPVTLIHAHADEDPEGGWGQMVILSPQGELGKEIVLIYAHLAKNIRKKVGEVLMMGEVFAEVGTAPLNGNWYDHLHIQAVKRKHFDYLLKKDLVELDGYGKPKDRKRLEQLFPDPLPIIDAF